MKFLPPWTETRRNIANNITVAQGYSRGECIVVAISIVESSSSKGNIWILFSSLLVQEEDGF